MTWATSLPDTPQNFGGQTNMTSDHLPMWLGRSCWQRDRLNDEGGCSLVVIGVSR